MFYCYKYTQRHRHTSMYTYTEHRKIHYFYGYKPTTKCTQKGNSSTIVYRLWESFELRIIGIRNGKPNWRRLQVEYASSLKIKGIGRCVHIYLSMWVCACVCMYAFVQVSIHVCECVVYMFVSVHVHEP